MEYELYYKKPLEEEEARRLQKATEFNDKHIYWLITEKGRQSKLGKFKRLATTYHSGRREYDDMYEFTEGDVLAENRKYIYMAAAADTAAAPATKKNMRPLEHMNYLTYPVYYPTMRTPTPPTPPTPTPPTPTPPTPPTSTPPPRC